MDKIFLYGLQACTLVGVYTWERQHAQTLSLDVEMGVAKPLGTSDDLAQTVNYASVHETICTHLAQCNFRLLECVADDVAQLILTQFSLVTSVRVRVVKLGILPAVREVGVEVVRERASV